jgi:uncharacterized membrane protein YphA (DoxX/SURF4 family)
MTSALSAWIRSTPHDARRSVAIVRIAVAGVLLLHPLHAALHPDDVSALALALAERGVPAATAVAWLGILGVAAGALGLLVSGLIRPAAIVLLGIVTAGAVMIYAQHWFVVGGDAVTGEPGIEYNVLLGVCLAGILYAEWPRGDAAAQDRAVAAGFDIIRIGSAAILLPHGLTCFVTRDVEGMRDWGNYMTSQGWPFGVALVWSLKGLETVSVFARLSRRFMVPACLGNLLVIVPGMWIAHRLRWYVLGPGEHGIEYSVLLTACAVACILAYWPVRSAARGAASVASASAQ